MRLRRRGLSRPRTRRRLSQACYGIEKPAKANSISKKLRFGEASSSAKADEDAAAPSQIAADEAVNNTSDRNVASISSTSNPVQFVPGGLILTMPPASRSRARKGCFRKPKSSTWPTIQHTGAAGVGVFAQPSYRRHSESRGPPEQMIALRLEPPCRRYGGKRFRNTGFQYHTRHQCSGKPQSACRLSLERGHEKPRNATRSGSWFVRLRCRKQQRPQDRSDSSIG